MTSKCKTCGHESMHSFKIWNGKKFIFICSKDDCQCQKFLPEDFPPMEEQIKDFEKSLNKTDAIFDMLQILDEKVTSINNKFDKLIKEFGWKT